MQYLLLHIASGGTISCLIIPMATLNSKWSGNLEGEFLPSEKIVDTLVVVGHAMQLYNISYSFHDQNEASLTL